MIRPVSRQTVEATLLLSFAVITTVCCAALFEHKNETGMVDEPSDGLDAASSTYISMMHVISNGIPFL